MKTRLIFSLVMLSCFISLVSLGQGNNWKLVGNSIGSTDFLGSTNSFPVIFKTNNLERMRITPLGLVGIGTTSPSEMLDVTGNIRATGTIFANTGLVVGTFRQGTAIVTNFLGVGTNTPTQAVDVVGNIKASGTIFTNTLNSTGLATFSNGVNIANQLHIGNSIIIDGITNDISTDDAPLTINSVGFDFNTIINGFGGQVAIGTFSPDANSKLDVNGNTFLRRDLKVATVTGTVVNVGTQTLTSSSPHFSDYKMSVDGKVVAKKYVATELFWADDELQIPSTLLDLEKEEEYAFANSHLFGVPSEKEIKTNGLEVGEMFSFQMRKTEQLFKYSFLFNKEIKYLKKENEDLKKIIAELSKRIETLEKK